MAGASIGTVFLNHNSTDLTTSLLVSTTTNDNYGINLTPSFGWFINDQLAVGVAPTVSYDKQKLLGKTPAGLTFLKDESNRFSAGLGGFARYYLSSTNSKMRFFGQYNLSAGISSSKREGFQYETNNLYVERYDYKSSGDFFVNTGLSFGMSKFVSSRTALDFYIGYKYSYIASNTKGNYLKDYTNPMTADETQRPDYDQDLKGHNLTIGLGFQVFLEKKK